MAGSRPLLAWAAAAWAVPARAAPAKATLVEVFALAAALAAAPGWAAEAPPACGPHLAGPARQQAEGRGWAIAFAPGAWPVPVGRHFALDITVCPPAGVPAPATLKVDADMPAHQHGMNYRPTVKALDGGRYSAEGLMFHMPGRWRVSFTVDGGAPLTHELRIP